MKDYSQASKSICIVLKEAQKELQQSANYVEKIVALQNTARILKLLTDYRDLGEEIEHALSAYNNMNNHNISSYVILVEAQLNEQIQNMEIA